MMKCDSLFEEFKRYEGQPVKIYTDDGRVHCGIDVHAFGDYVRLLDECSRTLFIDYEHIDAVVEPQMRLHKCCHDHCKCKDEGGGRFDREDREDGYERENGYDRENGNYERDRDCR